MKRNALLGTVLLSFLILVIGLTGNLAAREKEFIQIAGGGSGATWHIIVSGLCKIINEDIKWIDASPQTGGSISNTRRVATQKLKFGLANTDTAYHAIHGGPEFKEERYPDIRAVFSGHLAQWHMIALEKSNVKTLSDLRGKKVCIGYAGGAVETVSRAVLGEYGLIPDKDFNNFYLTPDALTDALRDSTIDAGAILTGVPGAPIIDLALTHKIRILSIEVEMQDKILKKHPYYFKDAFEPGLYPGLTKKALTVSAGTYLITHKNMDEELVYTITKLIAETTKRLAEIHPAGKEWNLETVKKGISIPIHPGALRYFKEKGLSF